MSSSNPADKIRLARAYAAQQLPWFAPALYRCGIVLTEEVSVAAVDRHLNVYWNAQSVIKITEQAATEASALAQLAFVWIHEISHVLRDHENRRDELKAHPTRWNRAADLEINDADWKGIQPPVPLPPVTPKIFDLPNGQLAEWYYAQLGESAAIETAFDDCGSGSHGQVRSWELNEGNQRLSDLQRETIRRQVAEEMKRTPSQLPESWVTWAKATLTPTIDWRLLLRQRLANAIAIGSGARTDYSYQRPGRRQASQAPFILPTLRGNQRQQLAVVLDTSGSMSDQPIDKALSELYGILQQAHTYVTLVPTDVVAHQPIRLQHIEQLRTGLALPGGGGTDMRAGIEAASRLQPTPDAILILTDGYTPYPKTAPTSVPLLFGILHAGERASAYAKPPSPPFGQDTVIEIALE